jgi:hypothetical protein
MFKIVNTGSVTWHSLSLKIDDLTANVVLYGTATSDAPFMATNTECPPGGDTLNAGATGYIGGTVGSDNAGHSARATIRLCRRMVLAAPCGQDRRFHDPMRRMSMRFPGNRYLILVFLLLLPALACNMPRGTPTPSEADLIYTLAETGTQLPIPIPATAAEPPGVQTGVPTFPPPTLHLRRITRHAGRTAAPVLTPIPVTDPFEGFDLSG